MKMSSVTKILTGPSRAVLEHARRGAIYFNMEAFLLNSTSGSM